MITSIMEYLERAVRQYGSAYAYEDAEEAITFEETGRRAEILGTALTNAGVKSGTVAVYMRKSAAMVSSFFGAVACGCSYSPMDTAMPKERLKLILDTLKPAAILTTGEFCDAIRDMGYQGIVILYEEALEQKADTGLLAERRRKVIDTDPLYIIFTSGSTGVPKGVVLPHRAVIDYVEWVTERFALGTQDVLGNQAELFFDLSVQDVFAPIACGCKTVFLPHGLFASPSALMEALKERQITVIVWAPSALCMIANLNGMEAVKPEGLRLVMFCGEVMPCRQLNYWIGQLPKVQFVNLYGPTETAEVCTYYVIDRKFEDSEMLPIGIPCENTDILVLNEENRPVQGTEVGELCVRGTSLALGYYRNPEKTAEAFVPNPCNSCYPELIYRTGDLVYYGEDHNLMYVSRKDFQIKHLGYRIELGEIETVAGLLEGVQDCACVYDERKKRIVLFYTGETWENAAFKERLSGRLPHYMIPNRIFHLDAMPYNRNGKTDRKVLKEMAAAGKAKEKMPEANDA